MPISKNDKEDISFVIHLQQPPNIVTYYQQIGRAGRKLEKAYVFLMSSSEDIKIIKYFIETAFPTRKEAEGIIKLLEKYNGLRLNEIEKNLPTHKASRIEKALMFLEKDGYVFEDKAQYYITPKIFSYDEKYYNEITSVKERELQQMINLTNTTGCYSKYIVNCLDDYTAVPCGVCSNCLGHDIISFGINKDFTDKAQYYIFNKPVISIEPRTQWEETAQFKKTTIAYLNEIGICLSRYGDEGYGKYVEEDKYSQSKRFRKELVEQSASILNPLIIERGISCITCVPSLRSNIVEDFTMRLAKKCNLPFKPLLKKNPVQTRQQKEMENSSHQCRNALLSFEVIDSETMPVSVVLVDDVVDSKWTLTVCGYKLMEKGCEAVYPFALADSSQRKD